MKRNRFSQVLAGILVGSIYEMRNYPIVLVNTALSPLSFLLLITFVSAGKLFGVAIEGGLIMSMFSSGMGLSSDLSHLKNDFKLQDMVVSSPSSPILYTTGMAISELVYSLPAVVILTALAAVYIHPTIPEALVLASVLGLMFLSSVALGFMLSTISVDIVQSYAFSRLFSTLFSTLPPVYYPITDVPLPFRYVAYLSPTTYAAEIAQNSTGYLQLASGMVGLDVGVLLGVTLVILVIALKKTRWREA